MEKQKFTNPHLGKIPSKSLQVGPYEAHAVPTGIFGLDGGAMFGTVPKVLWEKTNPPDTLNRIPMEARALLLMDRKAKRNILIDCGVGGDFIEKYGEKLGPKFAEQYAVDRAEVSLSRSLSKLGLQFSDITDVILTHLHFDHAGGATEFRDGAVRPTFPNATYYVQRANLETASTPNRRERASYFGINFLPLKDSGQLRLLDGDVKNILPFISVGVSNGHTLGQQFVRISDPQSSTTLYYCGDVIPTSTQVRLAWVMGYDLRPLELIDEKAELLKNATQENAFLFFEHDPYMDIATVREEKGDFAVDQRFSLG